MRPLPPLRIFLGWTSNEMRAYNVAQASLKGTASCPVSIHRLSMSEMVARGYYKRPTEDRGAGYWDVISDAPMSTGHAIARFLVPHLCEYDGWALFADGDVLFRVDINELFTLADETYAVQVVQHEHNTTDLLKKDGQLQTSYLRKNWSSVMLFNCGHPANGSLTVDLVNSVPGRDLHRFCWLDDSAIGALPARWNHLVGWSAHDEDASIVHFTLGTPDLPGFEHQPFSDEWYEVAEMCGYRLVRPYRLIRPDRDP